MFWDYFRWTREVKKGMECIGYRMPFSKKGKCFAIFRTAAARKRIAQVCMNSYLGSKYFCILDFHLNLISFWYLNTFWNKTFSQTLLWLRGSLAPLNEYVSTFFLAPPVSFPLGVLMEYRSIKCLLPTPIPKALNKQAANDLWLKSPLS